MYNSGQTPLIRARNLEKRFNIGRIYLKLEGTNPTGHMIDRIAEMAVFAAKKRKYNHIVADGSNYYLKSISHFCLQQHIKLSILRNLPKKKIEANVINLKPTKKNIKQKLSQFAEEHQAYIASQDEQTKLFKDIAYEKMADELLIKTRNEIDHVYISNHFSEEAEALNKQIFKRYMDDTILTMPQFIEGVDENQINDLKSTYRKQVLTSEEKTKIVRLLRQHEQIKIPAKDTLAFGAFYKDIEQGKIEKGRHVIILENAKTSIDIQKIQDFKTYPKQELINMTIKWLSVYKDSIKETEDAIEQAMKKGYILIAKYQQIIEGICVIVNTGFDDFIPSYHLAYIGTDPMSKGRGVGTELIQRAIDLTDGSLSLHVDLINKNARRLYEKMGFKLAYYRMIYDQK